MFIQGPLPTGQSDLNVEMKIVRVFPWREVCVLKWDKTCVERKLVEANIENPSALCNFSREEADERSPGVVRSDGTVLRTAAGGKAIHLVLSKRVTLTRIVLNSSDAKSCETQTLFVYISGQLV